MHSALLAPTPIDMPLPVESTRIGIYSASGAAEVDRCRGADAEGRCPRADGAGNVACAGRVVVLPAAVRGSRAWEIPAGYQRCPVASYLAYRQL